MRMLKTGQTYKNRYLRYQFRPLNLFLNRKIMRYHNRVILHSCGSIIKYRSVLIHNTNPCSNNKQLDLQFYGLATSYQQSRQWVHQISQDSPPPHRTQTTSPDTAALRHWGCTGFHRTSHIAQHFHHLLLQFPLTPRHRSSILQQFPFYIS